MEVVRARPFTLPEALARLNALVDEQLVAELEHTARALRETHALKWNTLLFVCGYHAAVENDSNALEMFNNYPERVRMATLLAVERVLDEPNLVSGGDE